MMGSEIPEGMDGINVDLRYLEQDVIEQTQSDGKFLGVWYWTVTDTENNTVYDKLFGKTGKIVDFFFSDKPLEAMRARDLIQNH